MIKFYIFSFSFRHFLDHFRRFFTNLFVSVRIQIFHAASKIPFTNNIYYFSLQITCPKNGTIQELSAALGQMINVPAERLTVTDVYNHRYR